MMPTQPQVSSYWWRFLATHNPCYVISALLTLYGLHISFSDNIDPTRGWLQLQLFIGYMALLALTGILVVRFGQVWEDARMLFLLLLLLMVALSVSFDRVCLDNEYLGFQFLSIGLAASLTLCEVLLKILKVRLPWRYRGVLYAQLTLLFAYPAWLGHLSLTDQLTPLAWWTLAFPTLVAISILMLVPAARSGAKHVRGNGTALELAALPVDAVCHACHWHGDPFGLVDLLFRSNQGFHQRIPGVLSHSDPPGGSTSLG